MDYEYHESDLSPETREMHRALKSLQEELEAVDWYQQRVDATGDAELRAILEHNELEELEHAAMLLEWLRRRSPRLDRKLRTLLFTPGAPGEPALSEEEDDGEVAGEAGDEGQGPQEGGPQDLGIGSLR